LKIEVEKGKRAKRKLKKKGEDDKERIRKGRR
jgi:hypothetical protein